MVKEETIGTAEVSPHDGGIKACFVAMLLEKFETLLTLLVRANIDTHGSVAVPDICDHSLDLLQTKVLSSLGKINHQGNTHRLVPVVALVH